jgi:thioredoxin reductase (NADPH)
VYHLGQRVEKIEKLGDGQHQVTTSKGTVIHCKAILIAAGCGAFGPNRPPLDGIEEYEGKSVFYMVAKREEFRGKSIVIAGGGDSAVDWALSLADVAKKIYVVHRRPKFRCAPDSAAKLDELAKSGAIELVIPYQLEGLNGEQGNLSAVIVKTLDGEVRELAADVLLPFFGLAMELGPIANWGLGVYENHILVDAATMATDVPGVFAIGDIATYRGKLKLILCGFAEAAQAVHAMHAYTHPGEALHFEYSTNKGVPK